MPTKMATTVASAPPTTTKDEPVYLEDEGIADCPIEILEISSDISQTPEVTSVNTSLCDSGLTESLNLHCLECVLEWPTSQPHGADSVLCSCTTKEHSGFEEYMDDIYFHRLSIEDKYHVPSCLDSQPQVTPGIRAVLIQWLTAVHHEFKLCQDTLYLSVNIMDRVLDVMEVSRDCLELLAITSLLVACKQDEVCPPEINDLLDKCRDNYTRDQVKQLEMIILMATAFDLMVPTVQQFLEYFASFCLASFAADGDEDQLKLLKLARALGRCILELSLQEYVFCQFRPSLFALCVWKASVQYVKTCDGNYVPPGVAFTKPQFDFCLSEVHLFISNFQQNCSDMTAVSEKFMNLYGAD